MKLDDRDIVCETDYSPLSNEELAAQIEWHAAAMSGVSAYVLERITGPARALMARVEAAEAEAQQEHEAAGDAQGWRPVTEEPDADAMYPVRVQYRGQVYLDREMRNWNRASGWNDMFAQSKVVEWYPLPPAPQGTTR